MLTLRAQDFKWKSYLPGGLGAGYLTLANAAATWQHDYGQDPTADAFTYLRGAGCEPLLTATPGTDYAQTQPLCNSGLLVKDGIMRARELTAENAKLVNIYHQATNTPTSLAYGDRVFGSLMGDPNHANTGGVYVPALYNLGGTNLRSIQLAKWYGFYFGMGMNHQWPAVRLGGVATDTDRRTMMIPFRLASVATAAEVAFIITEPNGLPHVAAVCTTSPCAVPNIDGRQASHIYQMRYQNASHAVLATSDTMPLYVLQ